MRPPQPSQSHINSGTKAKLEVADPRKNVEKGEMRVEQTDWVG